MTPATTRVAVCIPTYRRPQSLRRLLLALSELQFREPTPQVSVVVADNDPAQTARVVTNEMARQGAPRPQYVAEPRKGVAHVRNAAIAAAGAVDFVAFIDDDEVPEPQWLAELLSVQRQTGADVVTGPVLPDYPAATPKWLLDSEFLAPLSGSSAVVRDWAATGNVLVRRSLALELGGFDPEYGRTGGEDVQFFGRAAAAGALIVWAEHARVLEAVPPDRLVLAWHLRRAVREGNISARVAQELSPAGCSRSRRAVSDVRRLLRCGLGAPVVYAVGRRAQALRGMRMACSAVGALAAEVGLVYEQYGEGPGRWRRHSARS